jgi:hypothetical protein
MDDDRGDHGASTPDGGLPGAAPQDVPAYDDESAGGAGNQTGQEADEELGSDADLADTDAGKQVQRLDDDQPGIGV